MSIQDQSTLCANESISKSSDAVLNRTQQDPFDFQILTEIPHETYNFQWIIRQFSILPTSKALYSTNIHDTDTSCYQLKIVKGKHGFRLFHVNKAQCNETLKQNNFRGRLLNSQGFLIAGEEESNKISSTINLDYQVTATDNRGNELMKWSACFSDTESANYDIGEYMNNTLEQFPDDSLMLNCKLTVNSSPVTVEIKGALKPSLKSNGWEKLSMDLKILHQNCTDADVTLVAGTEKIRAHKLILATRSPVFKKIFHHDMKEAEQNSVAITDVEFSTLQRLVEFLYTGIILDGEHKYMNVQELFNLYYAADKYEILDLREMVGNTLLGRIQVDNAVEILVCVERHNDIDLKHKIMNFIKVNVIEVFKTDAWKSCVFHHPKLVVDLYDFFEK